MNSLLSVLLLLPFTILWSDQSECIFGDTVTDTKLSVHPVMIHFSSGSDSHFFFFSLWAEYKLETSGVIPYFS